MATFLLPKRDGCWTPDIPMADYFGLRSGLCVALERDGSGLGGGL